MQIAPGENMRIDGERLWDEPHGDGEDRSGRRRRQQPPDPDRRRRRGPRPVPELVRGGGLHDGSRRARQHVRPARGHRSRRAAGLCGQPSRHPADGREVRRGSGRPRRAGDRADAERSRHEDEAPDRRHKLDERGGHALRPRDAGLWSLRRRPRQGLGRGPDRREGPAFRRGTRPDRLARRRGGRGAARCMPSSNSISSRARSWRRKARRSASSPTARGCGGCR